METVYSGVVSIRNLRLAMFLAELNDLELWGADVGNAYLQALTREKLYIVGGPEFEALQGHVLVMYKALYVTEFRQPLQVQSHLEMPRILVQLGHTQRT